MIRLKHLLKEQNLKPYIQSTNLIGLNKRVIIEGANSQIEFEYPLKEGDKYRIKLTDNRYVDFTITMIILEKKDGIQYGEVGGEVDNFSGNIACDPSDNVCGRKPVKIGDPIYIVRYSMDDTNNYCPNAFGRGTTWFIQLRKTFGGSGRTPQDIFVGLKKLN